MHFRIHLGTVRVNSALIQLRTFKFRNYDSPTMGISVCGKSTGGSYLMMVWGWGPQLRLLLPSRIHFLETIRRSNDDHEGRRSCVAKDGTRRKHGIALTTQVKHNDFTHVSPWAEKKKKGLMNVSGYLHTLHKKTYGELQEWGQEKGWRELLVMRCWKCELFEF